MDLVPSIKKLYRGLISQPQLVIKPPNLRILISNPFIRLNCVVVTAFDHKWSRENEIRHLCLTEGVSHIEIGHLPLHTIHKTAWVVYIDYFSSPVAEIT